MVKMVFATTNQAKFKHVRSILAGSCYTLILQTDAGIVGEAEEERDARATLVQNARIKARYAFERLAEKAYVVADDPGIFITALDGVPGVQTRYWGGDHLTSQERMQYCLEQMQGIHDRSAVFRTAVVLIRPDGTEDVFFGATPGTITTKPRGLHTEGMPYYQIFRPEGSTKTWSQMRSEKITHFSHRGRAFEAMLRALHEKTLSRAH